MQWGFCEPQIYETGHTCYWKHPVTPTGGLKLASVKHCAVCVVHLFPLTQQLSLLLQDLLIKLGVKQEAATLSLHQGAAELSETPLEAILRDPHLEEETLRRVITHEYFKKYSYSVLLVDIDRKIM